MPPGSQRSSLLRLAEHGDQATFVSFAHVDRREILHRRAK
jgi:hypothetical protein